MPSSPIRKDYIVYAGDTLRLNAVYKAGDPAEPVDLTGWTGEWGVQHKLGDVEKVWKVDLTLGADGSITGVHESEEWPTSGRMTHQVRLVNGSGDRKTYIVGLIDVKDPSLVEAS